LQVASTAALWITSLLLLATTLWRLRKPIDAALLVPGSWLVATPFQALLLADRLQFVGAARDNMYIAVSIANLGFVGFQVLAERGVIASLQERVRRIAAVRGVGPGDNVQGSVRYWFGGLLVIAVGLAVLHWALMPQIPMLMLFSGADDHQIQVARENSAKLLDAPTMLKYTFAWNSRFILPLLFMTAVLYRWRWRAVFVGVFGLLYLMSPLEKLPSVLFVLGPFIGIAIRDSKRLWSPLVIVGVVVSLLPAYGINQAVSLSSSLHPTPRAAAQATPTPTPVSPVSPGSQFTGLPTPIRGALDLVLRRIGEGPTDVTYNWFAYFPEHHPFMNGAGWEPWRVLSPGWQSPANLVGLWAYYGKQGYSITSLSAYGSFIADGWGEFGMVGVLIATLLLLMFAAVLEMMRALAAGRLFCLACYATALVLFAVLTPQAGIPAMLFSNGLALAPLIVVGYLWTESRHAGVREVQPAGSPA
jgi:hypothetical protein